MGRQRRSKAVSEETLLSFDEGGFGRVLVRADLNLGVTVVGGSG